MNHDSPDTIAMDETQWQSTHLDDVFLPSVRVQLGWGDVEGAVARGAVLPAQAHALWAGWASPVSGLRVGATGLAPAYESTLAEQRWDESAPPAAPGVLQKYGLLLGLVAGAVLGAAGTYLALG